MLNTFKSWYKSPYTENMDATHWFLFLGLLLFIMAGWRFILAHIVRDI